MGKGDTYRRVDRKKWDAAWARIEKNKSGKSGKKKIKN